MTADAHPHPRARRRQRVAHALFALSFLAAGIAVVGPALQSGAEAAPAAAVTRTVVATRSHTDADGNTQDVSTNTVSLSVSQAVDLRGRQEIHVSWKGARPTGGVVSDPTKAVGSEEEYPVVLLQCRGVDSAGAVPAGQARLTPETCWTGTSTERYLPYGSTLAPWRFDGDASAAARQAIVGAPAPLPPACTGLSVPSSAHWLPLRAIDGAVYPGGPDPSSGCIATAPETDDSQTSGLPSNTTYGVTGLDGTGTADFSVWSAAENGTLGCTVAVSCALVAVPIVGLSCDAFGTKLPAGSPQTTKTGTVLSPAQLAQADTECRRTGAYQPGELRSNTTSSDLAVSGSLWWSPSNWRNRITVPLQFAATGEVCDEATEAPEEILGSVVLNELTASWRPTFCTSDDLFPFTHIQQSDELGRSLVQLGEVDAAFSSVTPEGGYSRPVVQAPTAFGGFAIAFTIDDLEHRRRTSLRLNARLVAKLLTSSYPTVPVVKNNHPSIGGNPYNISLDPEFQALNPGLPATSSIESAAALQITSASSDMMNALTSWLDADPEARAWLDGYADPWGMTVNDSYRGIDLPLDSWPLRDDWVAPELYQSQNACYGRSPTPFMQLVANPLSSLSAIQVNMQYASSAVQLVCNFDGYDETTAALKQQGRQTVGFRFVLGLVSLSSAERYNLTTADLQSSSTVRPGQQFTDGTGRTFVAGDTAGLRAAAALLTADATHRTWALDYSGLASTAGARAYPGAMPVYTVVPTSGLSPESATKLAKLLCYTDGAGQVQGTANGQLPAGYLPLTQPDGLGAQRAYLRTAIAAVRAQAGDTPALDATSPEHDVACDFSTKTSEPTATATTSPTTAPTTAPATTPAVTPPPAAAVDVPVASDPPAAQSPVPTAKPSATPEQPPATAVEADAVLTSGQSSLFGRVGPGGLLVMALATAIAGVVMRWYDAIAAVLRALTATTRDPGGTA